jgi:hypothetical protein
VPHFRLIVHRQAKGGRGAAASRWTALNIGKDNVREGGGEVLDRFIRIEANRLGVSADVGAAVDAARPPRAVAAFQAGEEGRRHLGGSRDSLERDAASFTLAPHAIPKCSTFAHHGCCSSRDRAWASQSLLN